MSEHDPDQDNFYSIIDRSRELLDSNDWWTVNQKDAEEFELKKESDPTSMLVGEN